jgi:hypothetical protein
MNNQEENLDLLDLDENEESDALPEVTPFSAPRPKRPWLLMALGVAIIVLATWIIIARVGGDSGTTISVDLDAPIVATDVQPVQPVKDLKVPPKPVESIVVPKPVEKPALKPEEVKPAEVKPVENAGAPVRVISDRKEVTFNPDKKEAPKPAAKPQAQKKITPPVTKPKATAATNGNIYVQFGSYSTRELAIAAEHKIRNAHTNLFNGKQFVILAAEVNGKTTYRLRVAFKSAVDANGFCRNAKSDGLDCYVTK